MKLKLAAVAVALAALAHVANAATQPQPSFNDSAAVESASPVVTVITTTAPQNPLPSFNG
jgi:hypothetical protein